MDKYKPICEVAEEFNVSRVGVRYWLQKYKISYEFRKTKGVKRRIFLDVDQLKKALDL